MESHAGQPAADRTILVYGAGAIGGTVGAYLARAGHDVLFVDQDAAHVAAMNAQGLTIEGPIAAFNVPARAALPADVAGVFDRILLCVKAHHTEGAARALAPHLAENGHVVSLQNGLNELVIADIVGRARTVGAFVNYGADYLSPGVVHFGGRGAVVLGELDGAATPRLAELHALMRIFEPNAITTDNIMGYLWGKLGYGALLFATALTPDSICDVLADPAPRPLLTAIAAEAVAVADALGIAPLGFNGYDPAAFRAPAFRAPDFRAPDFRAPDFRAPDFRAHDPGASFDAMVAHNATSAKTHSGIWRDLAVRRRKTEVDAQLGPIVSFGAQHGVPTPAVAGLIAMIHEVEDGARPLAAANLAELAGSLR